MYFTEKLFVVRMTGQNRRQIRLVMAFSVANVDFVYVSSVVAIVKQRNLTFL